MTRPNPFRIPLLARAYESALEAHATQHRTLFAPEGENRLNAIGAPFWKGYHDEVPGPIAPRGTIAWACYRAGQAVARRERRDTHKDKPGFTP